MKRSDRFARKARHGAMMAAMIFSGTGCVGIWSVRVGMDSASGGALGFLLALTGLFWGASMLREAFRHARLARNEQRWEWEREVRPRI